MHVGMIRKKHILHCIPTMEGGGAERQLCYLCRGLVKRGWEIHVALMREGHNIRMLRESGAVVHPIRYWSHYDPLNILRICSLIRAIKPSLVQTWLPMMDTIGGVACRLTGTPQIISERCSLEAHPGDLRDFLRIFVASSARAVVSNSSQGDVYWRRKLKCSPPRFVIPNALLLNEIREAVPVSLQKLDGHTNEKIVLFVGRFDKQKDLENLVCALRRVTKSPKVAAFLVGDGPMRPAIERMIHNEGLSGRVFLPGYVANPWSWMKRADIFVSVSLFEGMPNTVMEAMACGCPAVVSDIPQHREILDESEATFVLPCDPDSIASGIDRLLGNPAEALQKALCAKERASKWTISAMTERYERVYLDILGHAK